MYSGCFNPLHLGHVDCIIKTAAMCERLYIVVDNSPARDVVSLEQKRAWLHAATKHLPNIVIREVETPNADKKDFDWDKGMADVMAACGEKLDVVFVGGDYKGTGIFERYFPDSEIYYLDRERFKISSTEIRKNPMKHWEMMPRVVQNDYVKKVVLVGTESCGKTTLAQSLARTYNTSYVPEVGRDVTIEKGDYLNLLKDDYAEILYRHKTAELEQLSQANKVMFVDTEAVVTDYYYLLQFGERYDLAQAVIDENKYDLWLYCEPDVEWVADGERCFGEQEVRERNNKLLKQMLAEAGVKYMTISGNYLERYEQACRLVDKLIKAV